MLSSCPPHLHFVTLVLKGRICHFTEWEIWLFNGEVIISSPWIWKGVSTTWQSGRYTLSYPRGRYVGQLWLRCMYRFCRLCIEDMYIIIYLDLSGVQYAASCVICRQITLTLLFPRLVIFATFPGYCLNADLQVWNEITFFFVRTLFDVICNMLTSYI